MNALIGRLFLIVWVFASSSLVLAEDVDHSQDSGAGRSVMVPPYQVKRRVNELTNACILGRPAPGFVLQPPPPPKPAATASTDAGTSAGGSATGAVAGGAATGGGSAGATGATGAPGGGASAQKPAGGDPQFAQLASALKKCDSCHTGVLTGTSLKDAKYEFASGTRKGAAGRKTGAGVLDALRDIPEMQGVNKRLTQAEKDALTAWSKIK